MAKFKRLFGVIIVISLLLSTSVLFITQLATAGDGEYETPPSNDKIEMMLIDSPPTPPVNVSHTIVNAGDLTASAVILNDVPTSEWTFGCTATAAGMLFGYYDRTGYPNMYTGPTNGGVCPLTDLGQGDPTNPRYPIPGSCYIIATENGLDGISSKAHVDDYWISYQSTGPDPWDTNWPEHTWGLCTADFMGTNQWKWDYSSYSGTDGSIDANTDGSTTYWYNIDGSKLYDWCPGPAYGTPTTSCCHGMRLFAESRGYSVEANYNQRTDNKHPNGFTFAEFQAEIDAGRPVLIHVTGHTMVGIGYDTATNSIYIHDTWDNDLHSMTWGGSYYGMELRAVTVIHLVEYSLTISSTEGGSVTTPGEGTSGYAPNTTVDLVAVPDVGNHYHFGNWTGDVSTIADVYAASTNITMNNDYSITANFELDAGWYSLNISSTAGGNVTTPGEGISVHAANTTVNLVAEPNVGYRFLEWTGNVSTIADVNAAATSITMYGNYSVTAEFIRQYDLTISSTAGGTVTTPGEGTFPYDVGTVVNLVATPDTGYQFGNWTGDVGTITDDEDATTTITMDDDYSITANFAASGGCFIATAAYGTPVAEEIQILREFRDEYLLTNPVGQALVDLYYTVSPPIAEFIAEHPSLKPIVRAGLLPAVAMSTVAVNTTPAEKAVIIGLVVLVSVAVAVWAARRRGRGPEYTWG